MNSSNINLPFEPATLVEYLKWKFINLPSLDDARGWRDRLGGRPLTVKEYDTFREMIDEDHANRMAVYRRWNLFQWYLSEVKKWFTSWNLTQFNNTMLDNYMMRQDMAREAEYDQRYD